MANDLQAYLASKYMSGPKAEAILATKKDGSKKKSKKKRKLNEPQQQPSTSYSGMILKDVDGDEDWTSRARDDELDMEEPGKTFMSNSFRKTKL
jgi:pre-mRNA-splicing factor CWC26